MQQQYCLNLQIKSQWGGKIVQIYNNETIETLLSKITLAYDLYKQNLTLYLNEPYSNQLQLPLTTKIQDIPGLQDQSKIFIFKQGEIIIQLQTQDQQKICNISGIQYEKENFNQLKLKISEKIQNQLQDFLVLDSNTQEPLEYLENIENLFLDQIPIIKHGCVLYILYLNEQNQQKPVQKNNNLQKNQKQQNQINNIQSTLIVNYGENYNQQNKYEINLQDQTIFDLKLILSTSFNVSFSSLNITFDKINNIFQNFNDYQKLYEIPEFNQNPINVFYNINISNNYQQQQQQQNTKNTTNNNQIKQDKQQNQLEQKLLQLQQKQSSQEEEYRGEHIVLRVYTDENYSRYEVLLDNTLQQFKQQIANEIGFDVYQVIMMVNSPKSTPLKYSDQTLIRNIKEFEHGTKIFLKDRYTDQKMYMVWQSNLIQIYNQLYMFNYAMTIDKNDFLKSTYKAFMDKKQGVVNINDKNTKKQTLGHTLKVNFVGQHALDDGGVKSEMFQTFIMTICETDKKYFKFYEDLNFISPTGYFNKELPQFYQFCGRILGEIFVHARISNIKLHPIFYKMLYLPKDQIQKRLTYVMQKSYDQNNNDTTKDFIIYSLNDLAIFNENQYKNLQYLVDEFYQNPEFDWSDLSLDFSIYNELTKKNEGLGPDKKLHFKEVNYYNFPLYIQYTVEHYLKIPELIQIAIGYQDVAPSEMLIKAQFDGWESISNLLEGSKAQITTKLLQKNTVYADGFTEKHPTIKMFWEAFEENFTSQEKRQFFYFVTAQKQLPLNGLFGYICPGKRPITIIKNPKIDNLPIAHTCMFYLELPAYQNKQQLIQKIKQAMYTTDFLIL